ncbi:MAG: ATP-binding cassette domain-containing protein [Actinobacteria bacterium]|nr:ATP-binding cassette domain-containing protein [Actinomycetota bacterium]
MRAAGAEPGLRGAGDGHRLPGGERPPARRHPRQGVPDPGHAGRGVRRGARGAHRPNHPHRQPRLHFGRRVVHPPAGHPPADRGRVHGGRPDRGHGGPPVRRPGVRGGGRARGVRGVQRGGLAPRARAGRAARLPRAGPDRHRRPGVRALHDGRGHRHPRGRPRPHRWTGGASRPARPAHGAHPGIGAGAGDGAGRVDGRARVRPAGALGIGPGGGLARARVAARPGRVARGPRRSIHRLGDGGGGRRRGRPGGGRARVVARVAHHAVPAPEGHPDRRGGGRRGARRPGGDGRPERPRERHAGVDRLPAAVPVGVARAPALPGPAGRAGAGAAPARGAGRRPGHRSRRARRRSRGGPGRGAGVSHQPGGVTWAGTTFAYPDGPVRLGPVDLVVEPGSVVLVVGDSGSGKSTLLRTVNGLVPHSSGGAFGGDVVVGGRSTTTHRPRDLADVVGFVHQTPEAQFVVDHVEHDIAFVLENLGTDAAAMRRRVEEALDALAVAHLRDRSPATLSGGERQRCAIAGALAAAPSVLVLDEPTSMLDPQGADDVLAALGRLNDDLGTTVVVAEHRLERAGPLADRALVLDRGAVAADGAPAAVIATLAGAPPVTHLGRLLGWEPPPLTVRQARAALRTAGGAPTWAVPVPDATDPTEAPATGDVLVQAHRVAVAHGPRPVLADVDLEVRQGEVVAVLGRNGSGKTSLLRALAGAHEPSSGSVDATVPVAYVPQEPDSLLYSSTVRAEVEATLSLLGRRDPAAVDRWLDALDLHDLAERHPRTLSVGQRQRVAIAAVAVGDAPVLVLDEPTRGIDAASRQALERALVAHRTGGGAVVLATHDVELAARVASRVLVLGDGEVVADGPARQVLAGSLFAPQVLRVLPPFLTVDEVAAAHADAGADR